MFIVKNITQEYDIFLSKNVSIIELEGIETKRIAEKLVENFKIKAGLFNSHIKTKEEEEAAAAADCKKEEESKVSSKTEPEECPCKTNNWEKGETTQVSSATEVCPNPVETVVKKTRGKIEASKASESQTSETGLTSSEMMSENNSK